jgi:hypothetical protein
MKTFLITILMCLSLLSFGQIRCGTSISTASFSFTKPVVANQVIGSLSLCDEDQNQAYSWYMSYGVTLWKVAVNPFNPYKGDIMVKNTTAANSINKSTTVNYKVIVKAMDNGKPSQVSNICTVTISPTAPPVEVTTFTFNFTKPIVPSQLIGTIIPVNAGFVNPLTWAIVSGNSSKLWNIIPYYNSCGVIVNYSPTSAANINRGTTGTYTLKISVTDGIKTSIYTVKLVVVS